MVGQFPVSFTLLYTLYLIAFRSGAKRNLSDMECTTFRSRAKQHISIAIFHLKIEFLKGTDIGVFSRRYGKLPGTV